jgi:hypothetical protein
MREDVKRPARKSTARVARDFLARVPSAYVFPIKAGRKAPPLFRNELELAFNDAAAIDTWAKREPNCNWGVALKKSRLIVPDVDTRLGKIGQQTFDNLEFIYGQLPATLTIRTPSGGLHYYFNETGTVRHRPRVSAFGPDIDSTNYVLLPGSALDSGGAYAIINDAPIAPAPDWFAEFLTGPEASVAVDQTPEVDQDTPAIKERAIYFLVNEAPRSIQGQNGEQTLLLVAGTLKDLGVSQALAVELVAEYYNTPKHCDPIWNVGEGPDADRLDTKVANAYRYLTQNAPGSDTPQADFADDPVPPDTPAEQRAQARIRKLNTRPRPRLRVPPGALTKVMATVQQRISREMDLPDPVFKRQGKLVHLSRNLSLGGPDLKDFERDALLIVDTNDAWLASRLERSFDFGVYVEGRPKKDQKDNSSGAESKDEPTWRAMNCPVILCKRIQSDTTNWSEYKTLHSTIEAPTLRADGSILDTPGYDKATGIYFDPGDVQFPPIPEFPTIEEGRAAMAFVRDVLCDFPFDGPVSEAVAISMLLTAAVRRTLGMAPAYGIDADDQEAGKTTLGKVAGAIATGRDIAVHQFKTSADERDKTFTALLLTATPVILFDNITVLIEGDEIEQAITAEIYESRPFGKNDTIRTAPTNALIIFTANKIRVGGTLPSRTLVTRLVPTLPLRQRTFKHRNLVSDAGVPGYVLENRPAIVGAILTALRAFLVHGKDQVIQKDRDRFSVPWSDMIRSAVIWYGFADPIRGGDKLREDDPTKDAQREVLRKWWVKFLDSSVTSAQLRDDNGCKEAIADGLKCKTTDVTSYKVTPYIENIIGINLDMPVRVVKEKRRTGTAQKFHLELDLNASRDWVQEASPDYVDEVTEQSDFGPGGGEDA